MPASWHYPKIMPAEVQGRDLSEDNFAQEERSALEILIREAIQNPLDARPLGFTGAVRVCLSIRQPGGFDPAYLSSLLPDEYRQRLEDSGGNPLPDVSKGALLIIEDFGTTGLEGVWDDQNKDGLGENWNAFWFREGEGAKATVGSNGRAGQGKITYYRMGQARAVFGYTIRNSDKKQLLMGRSAFRKVYKHEESKFRRHSFWCRFENEQVLPLMDDVDISQFRTAFGLKRTAEPGLSLVIPFPNEFDVDAAVQSIIAEFYLPIAIGKLEVSINGFEINASNIDDVASEVFPDKVALERKSSFSVGFRRLVQSVIKAKMSGEKPVEMKPGWDRESVLKEGFFPEGELDRLRALVEKGEVLSVRFPVTVKPKSKVALQSSFEVHLQVPEDLARVEEAYVRRDLLIGSECHLASSSHLQKARGLTLIADDVLSAFLADAEEPTHLKWNGSRPRLAEDYSSPKDTVRAVRQAAPRLLALLSNGLAKRDMKALAKYFTRPASETGKSASGGLKVGQKGGQPDPPPPPPIRKPFLIKTSIDSVRVLPNGSAAPPVEDLPMACVLELAYEGLDLDPFKAYDPFDFDLGDEAAHAIEVTGAAITERGRNRIRFNVMDPAFALKVPGFDPNIRLRARLNYLEKQDGAALSEE